MDIKLSNENYGSSDGIGLDYYGLQHLYRVDMFFNNSTVSSG